MEDAKWGLLGLLLMGCGGGVVGGPLGPADASSSEAAAEAGELDAGFVDAPIGRVDGGEDVAEDVVDAGQDRAHWHPGCSHSVDCVSRCCTPKPDGGVCVAADAGASCLM